MFESSSLQSEFRQALHRDNLDLADTLESLLALLTVDPECADARHDLALASEELRSRLNLEEELMLPLLELCAPVDATHLRAEHHEIRAQLDNLAFRIALRELDPHVCATFLSLLHGHAVRDQKLLHPLADQSLLTPTKADIIGRMQARQSRHAARPILE
ncbi:MAG: hypothetical protein QM778_34530 [Myxococcales bacterium]